MGLVQINWLPSQLQETQTLLQILYTAVFLFVLRFLYNLLYAPLIYSWDDPIMQNQSPTEKSKRQVKAIKRSGLLPPFPNGWYRVLCSGELLPGQVKHINALGKEWAIFRTESGKPGLVGAYCPHLGADLSQGKVTGETLTCPFHAFEFNTTGTCTKIPNVENVPKALKCQDVFPIREVNAGIFVWYDVDGNLPTWEVESLIEEEEKHRYKYIGRTHTRVHTHLQEINENGADTAHLAVVHPETILHLKPLWHQWGITWEPSSEAKHRSNFMVHEVIKIGNFEIPGTKFDVEGHHVGPSLVHFRLETMFGIIKVVHQILPLEGFLQDSVYQMWVEKCVPFWYGKIILRSWVQQLEKDVRIWNQKNYLPAPQLSTADGPIVQYRRWFKQFYSSQGTKKKFDLTDKELF